MFFDDHPEYRRVAWVEAHEAALNAPFWDVLQASGRAALFYGQLRRCGASVERARHLAALQFSTELLSADEVSGIRLGLSGYRREVVEIGR